MVVVGFSKSEEVGMAFSPTREKEREAKWWGGGQPVGQLPDFPVSGKPQIFHSSIKVCLG